jgi:hypothetical protein
MLASIQAFPSSPSSPCLEPASDALNSGYHYTLKPPTFSSMGDPTIAEETRQYTEGAKLHAIVAAWVSPSGLIVQADGPVSACAS